MAILVLAILLGFLLADHYGVSTDELSNITVGRDALLAFRDPPLYRDYLQHGARLAHHGPSYFMLYYLGSETFSGLFPQWNFSAGRHLTNYLSYLLGLAAFYAIARRFLNWPYALLTTIFFGTQPLLFGHAFVNQKDTPFLAAFTGTVAAGMWAVDSLVRARGASGGLQSKDGLPWFERARSDFGNLILREKVAAFGGLLLLVLVAADVLFFETGLSMAKQVIGLAHEGKAPALINQLYRVVAEDAFKTPVTVYQDKLTLAYWILRPFLLIGAAWSAIAILLRALPSVAVVRWKPFRSVLLPFGLAAALLGWTMSIRPIGAYAGALVAVYCLYKDRLRSIGLMFFYGSLALAAMYLTWPYLWQAPLDNFIRSVQFTGDFSKISEYFGAIVQADNLPWHYFPTFVLITLTEPLVPLLLIGSVVVVLNRSPKHAKLESVLAALWLAGPLFALIALHMGVYGNIRHLHFVLVPIFLFAGVGLQKVLRFIRIGWLQVLLALFILAPGVLGIVQLHPYEYSYYNSFIGGAAGAADGFTLDRWCISYRQAMEYVNAHANPGDVVVALYSPMSAEPFAKDGVEVETWSREALARGRFLLTCSLNMGQYRGESDWTLIYSVQRQGAVFAEVFEKSAAMAPRAE